MAAPVLMVMGSDSDLPVMEKGLAVLKEFGIACEVHVCSAHRTPERAHELASNARSTGVQVIIAAAGVAAHLAGVFAASTTLPVIGVPIDSGPLKGVDALYSTVQMPPGIPVASMAIGGAKNAALFAAQILALKDDELAVRLVAFKREMADKVAAKDARLQERMG